MTAAEMASDKRRFAKEQHEIQLSLCGLSETHPHLSAKYLKQKASDEEGGITLQEGRKKKQQVPKMSVALIS